MLRGEKDDMTVKTARAAALRRILYDRRHAIERDVQSRIRIARTDRLSDVGDDLDHSDAAIQGDIERALIQMRAETLSRIDEALIRLDAGHYGSCFDCGKGISARRLRAQPFAVRCQSCEQRREEQGQHTRRLAHRREHLSLFAAADGS